MRGLEANVTCSINHFFQKMTITRGSGSVTINKTKIHYYYYVIYVKKVNYFIKNKIFVV